MTTSKLAVLTITLAVRAVRGGHFGFQFDFFRFRFELGLRIQKLIQFSSG